MKHLTFYCHALSFHCNNIDSEPFCFQTYLYQTYRFWTNQIPNQSDSEPIGFQMYRVLNISGSEPFRFEPIRFRTFWLQTYQTPNLSDSKPIKLWTYRIPNLSDSEQIGFWNLSDSEYIGFWTYWILNQSDSESIEFQTIWNQTHLILNLFDTIPEARVGRNPLCFSSVPCPFNPEMTSTPPSASVARLGTKQVNSSPLTPATQLTITTNGEIGD
jgi:hypothetical protein